MYQSKYKHKHADRRVIPEKVEEKPEVESVQTFHDFAAARQQQLAGLAAQQQMQGQMAPQNQFGGLASMFGRGLFG